MNGREMSRANKRPNTSLATEQTDGRKCRKTLAVQVAKAVSSNGNNAKGNINIQPTNLAGI